jgi:hypothetical protein
MSLTYSREANQLVEVRHENGDSVSQTSKETVGVAVDLSDRDVGVAIF